MSQSHKTTINWRLFTCAILFVLCSIDSSGFSIANRVVLAQSSKQPPKPTITKPSKTTQNSLVEGILKLLMPKKRAGGSRGDGLVCADSPVFKAEYPYLWVRQPLFVWMGYVDSVQVLDAESRQIVWQKSIDPDRRISQIRIDRPLELGKRYIWRVITDLGNDLANPEFAFQMVDAPQWKKIDRELKALEQKLKGQQLNSEEIALERVNYFAQRQMWGDVQETLAVLPSTVRNPETIALENKIRIELSMCIRTK
jgi:Domain of Unknown Function (DUF928)